MNIWNKVCDTFLPHARNNYTPFAIGRKSLSVYASFMVALKLIALFSVAVLPQSQAFASEVTPVNILELTNYSRSVFGLSAVSLSNNLTKAAQAKAEDMIKNQYFAHTSPQGLTPWDFIKGQGYNYIIAGENLALNFSTSEGVENAWMNSPGHKANILNKDFQDIGIGIASGNYKGQKTTMVVQIFGTSIDQPFTPKLTYSNPVKQTPQPVVTANVPTPVKIGLQAPILENPKFSLTNKKEYQISGFAPEANSVYILVNHHSQVKMEVIQGKFSGVLSLEEGDNVINAVSFTNNKEGSAISNNITIRLDSTAPVVASTEVQPINENGQIYYSVQIQASADVAKMIASIDNQNIMLQPTADSGIWVGRFAVDPTEGVNGRMVVSAFDLAGNSQPTEVANLSSSLQQSYSPTSTPEQVSKALAKHFTYDQFNLVYLYFGLFLLFILTLAIGIKRNIQHLGLITHTSAMAAMAIVLWVT